MHSNEQINETTTTSTTRLYSYLINVLMTIYFSKWITSLFQTNYLPSVWKCWQNLYKKYKEECYCNPNRSCPYIDNSSYGNVQRYIFKMIDNKSHIGRYKHKNWPSFTNEITDENQFKTTHTNAIARNTRGALYQLRSPVIIIARLRQAYVHVIIVLKHIL